MIRLDLPTSHEWTWMMSGRHLPERHLTARLEPTAVPKKKLDPSLQTQRVSVLESVLPFSAVDIDRSTARLISIPRAVYDRLITRINLHDKRRR